MIGVIGRTKKGVSVSLDPSYAMVENRVSRMVNWQKAPKTVEVTMTAHGTKGSIIADVYGIWTFHNGGPDNTYLVGHHRAQPTSLSLPCMPRPPPTG